MMDFLAPEYYLFFLPVVFLLTFGIASRQRRRQIFILLVMSYLFFWLASGWHLLLLLDTPRAIRTQGLKSEYFLCAAFTPMACVSAWPQRVSIIALDALHSLICSPSSMSAMQRALLHSSMNFPSALREHAHVSCTHQTTSQTYVYNIHTSNTLTYKFSTQFYPGVNS